MDDSFIKERISFLRMRKGVSEYKMSLDLGHSKGYIQSISSGRTLPSVSELLYICEYLGISPKDFFDERSDNPALVEELSTLSAKLEEDELRALILIAERLSGKKAQT